MTQEQRLAAGRKLLKKMKKLSKKQRETLKGIRVYKDPKKERELKRRLRLGLDLSGMAQF